MSYLVLVDQGSIQSLQLAQLLHTCFQCWSKMLEHVKHLLTENMFPLIYLQDKFLDVAAKA